MGLMGGIEATVAAKPSLGCRREPRWLSPQDSVSGRVNHQAQAMKKA
jgi:hypothetical protein